MSNDVLVLSNVTKRYGRQVAVNNVSFRVGAGSIFGLLGPNGAGKTSTIRMINGITYPDGGTISIFGETQNENHQDRIGYMPEERGLYKKLSVRDQLEYLGSLKGLNKAALKERIDHWLDRFEIRSWEKKKTQELSKGMQQKLQFIVTVLHDPQLLILDEPLSGLDPINAEVINETILDLRKQGKTIILSTHRMEQVEETCDDIVLINEGRVVLEGTLRDLKRNSGRTLISVRFDGDASKLSRDQNGYSISNITPNEALLELAPSTNRTALMQRLSTEVDILKWELVEPPIKELFLEAVRKKTVDTVVPASPELSAIV